MILENSKRKRRIGILGGTFDPIHLGHINLAIELKEKGNLDEVWFCPANISPFRVNSPPSTPSKVRGAMVSLAIEGIEGFVLNEIEFNRPPPSYTIDTIKELRSKNKDCFFYLLLGEDSVLGLGDWKDVDELVSLAPPLVGCRRDLIREQGQDLSLPQFVKESIDKGKIKTSYMDISGSNIRKRLNERLYCGHLLPGKVLDYIYKNQLYSSNI